MLRDNDKIIGRHGCNIYFKEFTVSSISKFKTYRLGSFYFVRRSPEYPIAIAEFQLIWLNTKDGKKYASAKLYFNPKEADHDEISEFGEFGEDEVIEADKHVVIECLKISSWECSSSLWYEHFGKVVYDGIPKEYIHDIYGSKCYSNPHEDAQSVKILSYPQYCRYKTCLQMLKNGYKLSSLQSLLSIGGLELKNLKTIILFSRWRFSKRDIAKFSLTNGIQAPVFKGRPRRKKNSDLQGIQCKILPKKYIERRIPNSSPTYGKPKELLDKSHNIKDSFSEVYPTLSSVSRKEESKVTYDKYKEKAKAMDFSRKVTSFMKQRGTPIIKIPSIGYKIVNLHQLFVLVTGYGGYEQVTSRKQWRTIYNHLGHSSTITNAATITRKAYETLLLPYEKHLQITPSRLHSQPAVVETKHSNEVCIDVTDENEDVDVINEDDNPQLKSFLVPDDITKISSTTSYSENVKKSTDNSKAVRLLVEKRRGRPTNEFRNKIEHLKVTNEKVEVEIYPALSKYSRVPAWLNELNVDIVNPQRKRKKSSLEADQNVCQRDKLPVTENRPELPNKAEERRELNFGKYDIPFHSKTRSETSTVRNVRKDYCVMKKPSSLYNNVSTISDGSSFCEFQIKSVRSLAPNHPPPKEISVFHYPCKTDSVLNDMAMSRLCNQEMSNPHQYLTEANYFSPSSHYPVNGSFRSGHFTAQTFGREAGPPAGILHYPNEVISQRRGSDMTVSREMRRVRNLNQRDFSNENGGGLYVRSNGNQHGEQLSLN